MATLNELIGDVGVPVPAVNAPATDAQAPELLEQPEVENLEEGEHEIPEETPPPEPAKEVAKPEIPQVVPLPVYMELKHELRDTRAEIAQLRTEVLRPKAPSEKDPIDVFIEKAGGDPDTPIPGSVLKQHDAWKDRQTQQTAQITSADTVKQAQEKAFNQAAAELSDVTLGAGLGLEQVIELGAKYLSMRDKELIRDTDPEKMPREYYRRCVERTLASGTADAATLIARIQTARGLIAPTTPPKPIPAVPRREEVLKGSWSNAKRLGLV